MLADLKFPTKTLPQFHFVFANFLKAPPKFEPALLQSSEGGRGKRKLSKSGKNRLGEAFSRPIISYFF